MTPENEPVVDWLPADQLTVDERVQRAMDDRKRHSLARRHKPHALGVLTVSRRADGQLHVIDGQHRRAATMDVYGPEVAMKCHVHAGLTLADEAELFTDLNEQKNASALDKWRPRLVAEDEVATSIDDAAHAAGWTIGPFAGQVRSVTTLEAEWRRAERVLGPDGGFEVVRDALTVVTEAWGATATGVTDGALLGAVMQFLTVTDEFGLDRTRLSGVLAAAAASPKQWRQSQETHARTVGRKPREAMLERLHYLYNKGKRGKRLPELGASRRG